MTNPRLHDDLLQDFREQKKIIREQIELFDPLATSLRKPAAQRLTNKGLLIVTEILCYLLCLLTIAFTTLMEHIYPFTVLFDGRFASKVSNLPNLTEDQTFNIAVHGLGCVIALLLFILGRITARVRLKNNVLDLAGKNIKQLVGQHLKRKASIEAIEQRHFLELPVFAEGVKVNEVPNPGY